MSINFRAKIKSEIDYSSYLFPGSLGCCCTGSSDRGSIPFQSSYGECMASSGYFYVSDSGSCDQACLPQGTTGCCCSCFYGGMTEGIERSLCEDKNGIWKSGPCDEAADIFCITSSGIDKRSLRKCCGFTFSSGQIVPICIDVCTEEDCSKQKVNENYVPVFYPQLTCEDNPSCPEIQGIIAMQNNYFLTGIPFDDTYGNCCIQGKKCRCLQNVSYSYCSSVNGSFYRLQDAESSCADCLANCTNGEF